MKAGFVIGFLSGVQISEMVMLYKVSVSSYNSRSAKSSLFSWKILLAFLPTAVEELILRENVEKYGWGFILYKSLDVLFITHKKKKKLELNSLDELAEKSKEETEKQLTFDSLLSE